MDESVLCCSEQSLHMWDFFSISIKINKVEKKCIPTYSAGGGRIVPLNKSGSIHFQTP